MAQAGVVRNHATLIRDHGLSARAECDSEVLGPLLTKTPGPIALRAARTCQVADRPLANLGIWTNPARLLIVRHGNALWSGETCGGGYFAGLRDELSGQPQAIPDYFAWVLAFREAMNWHEGVSID